MAAMPSVTSWVLGQSLEGLACEFDMLSIVDRAATADLGFVVDSSLRRPNWNTSYSQCSIWCD